MGLLHTKVIIVTRPQCIYNSCDEYGEYIRLKKARYQLSQLADSTCNYNLVSSRRRRHSLLKEGP